jgi:Mycobacterium membrane protein
MTLHYPGGTSRAGDPYTAPGRPDPDDDCDDDVVYYEDTTRWRWVAAVAGAVLVLAVIGTVVILRGGDSAPTTARVVPSGSAPVVTSPISTRPPPAATTTTSPPPETMRTLTPSATTSTAAPTAAPQVDQPTITYTVSGSRQPGDIVTVTYIDESGAPRTDFNVTLPWAKTLPSGANMLLKSVTAVSLMSHLNCSITNGNGQTVASQNFNAIATTCNR